MLFRCPIDGDGLKIAAIVAVITVIVSIINSNFAWVGGILSICILAFFRDPDRVTPQNESAIISPADGTVINISPCIPPAELGFGEKKTKRVCIFMSVTNVHVNRSPVAGTIEKILYVPGKFFNASLDKANVYNERKAFFVRTKDNQQIVFVQIAGLIARRIRTDVKEGDVVEAGQRVGIIRFGSRVDVYLPDNVKINVQEGQSTIAGETVLAEIISSGVDDGEKKKK